MDLGQGRRGVDMGPSAVRYAGLENRLSLLGFEVIDSGNLTVPVPEETRDRPGDSGLEHLEAVSAINRNLADRVEDTLARGELAIILGGDHSLSAGSVAGAHRAGRVGVLWIDAHGDYNEPRTSPSGNLHGMPLASIAGREPIGLAPFSQEPVDPKDIALIGLRSIDPGERKNMIDDGVTAFTIREIDEIGIAEVTRQALATFDQRDIDRIHLSFDLDVLDERWAPGVGTPVPGGLSYREAHLLMELLSEDGRVRSLDLVEINPVLDIRNTTAQVAVKLTSSLLGQRIM